MERRGPAALRPYAENSAYLRAFCWIHLADYVIFDYDLPKGCDEEEMLKIMALAKQKDDI